LASSLVGVPADPLEPADPEEELADVLGPPPLPVGHHVQPGLLLQADGEPDAVIEGTAVCVGGQLGPAGEQIADGLRAGERADPVGAERREAGGARSPHSLELPPPAPRAL